MRSRRLGSPKFPLQRVVSSRGGTTRALLSGGIRRDNLSALALALLLELLLLGLAAVIYATDLLHPAPVMKDLTVLQLTRPAPEPDPPVPPPLKKVEKILPAAKPSQSLPEPVATPEPFKMPLAQDATPSPFAEKPVQPPPVPPSRPAEADALADYTVKIRNAVQAALIFPGAADALRYTGRTRVEFRLHQGHQSGARVIVSSGINIFDRAALQAVQDAAYPQPPEGLREQVRLFQVWVEFKR